MLQESSIDITRAIGLAEDTRMSVQDVNVLGSFMEDG